MLNEKEITLLREELATAKNPLFFYDGDGDGLASFLLLYRIHGEGKGIALRGSQRKEEHMVRKVEELEPDKVFVLDVPVLSQEMIDQVKRPIFWIDHHEPLQRDNVNYFNPRLRDPEAYIPTSRMCWQITEREQDVWIGTGGCLADWYMPDFIDEFIEKYPKFLPKKADMLTMSYKRKVGKLVKLLFFIQKGSHSEVRKSIKVLTRITSPDEIFSQATSQGKFIFHRFEKLEKMYTNLLKKARKGVTRSKLLLFYYTEEQWSFTTNVANELAALYPKKLIIVARRKGGRMVCSLRGNNVASVLEKALIGVEGGGGGHPEACGAVIEEEYWNQFLEQFKEAMK